MRWLWNWRPNNVASMGLESAELFESVATSIRDLLRVSADCSVDLARKAVRCNATAARRRIGYSANIRELGEALSVRTGRLLLALPMCLSSLALVRYLCRKHPEIELLVLETPLSRAYLGRAVSLHGPGDLMRRLRTTDGDSAKLQLVITFPDHEVTGPGTMWPVRFCRSQYLFSALEAMICARLSIPLMTFGCLIGSDGGKQLVWIDGAIQTEKQAREMTQWLAVQVETFIQNFPEDLLSWRQIAQRSAKLEWWHTWCRLKAIEGVVYQGHRLAANANSPAWADALRTIGMVETLLIRELPR